MKQLLVSPNTSLRLGIIILMENTYSLLTMECKCRLYSIILWDRRQCFTVDMFLRKVDTYLTKCILLQSRKSKNKGKVEVAHVLVMKAYEGMEI
jgi:hypothetical protein